ncbi:hypothetical protein XM38_007820 [Halomicronema hongdechloris C2206]|uniref:Uncharacterized protein n=1 Tax=Halomicronema hongdechloris C2206 TaxID=1641165 RepID=A0A1Z3HHR1_9CYAN|nr:hypothetical protein XM38_007820 [Halomicronema hongdechloris C2206]
MAWLSSNPQQTHQGRERSGAEPVRLSLTNQYLCPVCRHGHIHALVLMESFSCDFCRHMFAANLSEQTIHMVDGTQPTGWRWNGRTWKSLRQGDLDMTLMVWIVGILLIIAPVGLISVSAYMFPPLDEALAWPIAWAIITLLTHMTLVVWLLAEHYQVSTYIAIKVRLRQLIERFQAIT